MLSTISKVFLFIYGLSLFVILFLPPNASNDFSLNLGLLILIAVGLFALISSVSIANSIKKLKASLASRVFSIVLVDIVLYLIIMLFYGLGNIGVGPEGFLFWFVLIAFSILLGVSLLIGVVLVLINKNQTIQKNPNKTLLVILIIVLALLFYSGAVSGLARILQSPKLCSAHIEIEDNSFIFNKGMKDRCLFRVALDASSVDYCNQIKDTYRDELNPLKEKCILNVARDLGDISICYQLNNDHEWQQWQANCIGYIAEDNRDISMCEISGVDSDGCYFDIARGEEKNGNPEICNYIEDNETRYRCYAMIAIDKRDPSICNKYFPTNEILIQEGVFGIYSKEECIGDAREGSFR